LIQIISFKKKQAGWTLSNNNTQCYKLISIDNKDWDKASSYCKKQGGYLATPKSENENLIISNMG